MPNFISYNMPMANGKEYWSAVSADLLARQSEIQVGTRQVFDFSEVVGTISREFLETGTEVGHAAALLSNIQLSDQVEERLRRNILNLFPDFEFPSDSS